MIINYTSKLFLIFNNEWHCVKSVKIPSFFWSIFFCIWLEYEDLLRKSLYSVGIRENMDQKNSVFGHFSPAWFDDFNQFWILLLNLCEIIFKNARYVFGTSNQLLKSFESSLQCSLKKCDLKTFVKLRLPKGDIMVQPFLFFFKKSFFTRQH